MKAEFNCLLCPDILLPISADNKLVVKESDTGAKLRELVVSRIPAGSVAFELDHKPSTILKAKLGNAFSQLSCLINDSHSLANKACDLVIVSPEGDRLKVVIAELKSKKPNRAKCEKQLWNSKLFLDYLFSLLSEYHDISGKPDYRLVAFCIGPSNLSKPLTQQSNRPHRGNQEAYIYMVSGSKVKVAYGDFV